MSLKLKKILRGESKISVMGSICDGRQFNGADIQKMRPELLHKIPTGEMLEAIAPPPEFRADDYHYHEICENYPQLFNDLEGS